VGVIVGVVVAAILGVWKSARTWIWSVAKSAFASCLKLTTCSLPAWFLLVAIASCLVFVYPLPTWVRVIVVALVSVGTILLWRRSRPPAPAQPPQPLPPEWINYTQDTFFGVVWRWRYDNESVERVASFCPNDDMQLLSGRSYPGGACEIDCDECQKSYRFDKDYPTTINVVKAQIDRNIRNGDWKKAAQPSKQQTTWALVDPVKEDWY